MSSDLKKIIPEKLYEASVLLASNKQHKAEKLLREYLFDNPLDVNAMKLLADIGIRQRAYFDAGNLLTRALDIEPDYDEARLSYANLLHARQLPFESLKQLEILLKKEPNNIHYLNLKAVNLAQANKHEEALILFKEIKERFSSNTLNNGQFYLQYGHTLRANGQIEEAISAYLDAIKCKEGYGEAYWGLANLKTYSFSDKDFNTIKDLLSDSNCKRHDYYHLLFTLGKAEEDRKNFKNSIAAYMKGNQVKSKEVLWNVKEFAIECQNIKNFFTKQFFTKFSDVGTDLNDPIFVVGLPRSGSTLIEQILSSHSLIEGTTEHQNIIALSRKISKKRKSSDESQYPSAILDIEKDEFKKMGDAYINNTLDQRNTSKPYFIDKMPNNFFHIGLIHLILPNAKIIDARRNPMDCCFSNYKQLFGSGQGFSYSLDRIANYYLEYISLMDHWDEVLPGKVHRVKYESMVCDTENEITKLIKFCGFDIEDDCFHFYKNKRAVRTPSSEQVRQPIYTKGIGQWKNYEEYLKPLKDIVLNNE
mgnify:FL=1